VIRARFSKKEPVMKKKKVRRGWSKEDFRTLKSMAKDKQGVTKIAKALKRTIGATTMMAAKHGVSLSMRGSVAYRCEPLRVSRLYCANPVGITPAGFLLLD
jgi:hypothetical protein